MNEWLVSLLVNLALFGTAASLFAWRYYVVVGRKAKLRRFQYSLFELRDRVVELVVKEQMNEDDPAWKYMYRLLNDSARAGVVDEIHSGIYVVHLLRNVRPLSSADLRVYGNLPEPAKALIKDYVDTVVKICVEGSFLFRWLVRAPVIFVLFAKWKIDGLSLNEKITFEHFQANRVEISRSGLGVAA